MFKEHYAGNAMIKRKAVICSVILTLLLAVLLPAASLEPTAMAAAAAADQQTLVVYNDGLQNQFADYSWAKRSMGQTAIVHTGKKAIQMTPDGDGALYFYKDRILRTLDYPILEIWVHGGTAGGQQVNLILQSGGQAVATVPLGGLLAEGKPAAGKWEKARVSLAELNIPNGIYDGIMLQGATAGRQSALYFDDIVLVKEKEQRVLESIKLNPDAVSIEKGVQSAVTATALYNDGSQVNVTQASDWQSAHPEIATALGGQLRAVDAGTTVVSVTYGSKIASMQVKVTSPVPVPDPKPDPVPNPNPGDPAPDTSQEDGPAMIVYDDVLHAPFQNYSWAQHELEQTATVHAGKSAIRMDPSNNGGFYLYKDNGPVLVKDHDRLDLWVHGGTNGNQQVELKFNAGGETVAKVDLGLSAEGKSIPANKWAKVRVSLPELNIPNGLFDAILIQGAKDDAQPSIYIDDIRLLPKYVAPATLTEVLLSQYQVVLVPGDTSALQMTANYSDGTSKDVTAEAAWTTSDAATLAVDGGMLRAVGAGIARVTGNFKTVTAAAYVQVTSVLPIPVYKDSLATGYSDWSWGTRQMDSTEQVHSGSRAISFAARGYEGIWLHKDDGVYDTSSIYGLRFQLHGGANGGQKLKLLLLDGRNFIGEYDLDQALPQGKLPANTWVDVTVKLADMGIASPSIDGIVVQAFAEQDQGTVYLDDIEFLKNTSVIAIPQPELPKVSVAIDTNKNKRLLNPDIFGVNFEERPSDNASQMKFPFKRWGGNQMTRYNWELDVTNRAGDWYFLNIPNDTPDVSKLPNDSLSDRFIKQAITDKTKVLLQVPTIGWTPKSRDIVGSFSISKYGAQSGNECDWKEEWCRKDAGSGFLKDGQTHVTGNDPLDTSKQVGTDFMGRWIDHLKQKFGGYVRNYALDNEPALWGHAHWDVHPEMTTYDEIWNYTLDYGTMIKQKDPSANIYGPVSWGWCEYFYSGKDGCYPGDDMKAHGDKPFLEWYLNKVREYEQQKGTRLVDVLDIHYYPAENGIAFSNDESAQMMKRRFNSLKSLYDPTFMDSSSWIQEPVNLLPRMHDIIDRNAPGTKLAITEYNFGDGSGIGSGLAQAEALSIFAREGVDAATRWGALPANSPLEDAFKLFLDYDGQGSKIEGNVVQTTSSNVDAVGAYTVVSAQGKTFILLFNKDAFPRTAEVKANVNMGAGEASVFRFDAKQRLQAAKAATIKADQLAVDLPARSATLIVIP